MVPTIRVAGSVDDLAKQAAERFAKAAVDAVVATGRFAVGLSGGSTPQKLFQILASDYSHQIPWDKTHVLFVDERCVPPDDAESNFGMACREILDRVPIDYAHVHRLMGEKDPQAAADEYNALLQKDFGKGLDLVLLGVGEDGHTASLFPGTAALGESGRACVANFVPEKRMWRLTMTASYINRAFDVLIPGGRSEQGLRHSAGADRHGECYAMSYPPHLAGERAHGSAHGCTGGRHGCR